MAVDAPARQPRMLATRSACSHKRSDSAVAEEHVPGVHARTTQGASPNWRSSSSTICGEACDMLEWQNDIRTIAQATA